MTGSCCICKKSYKHTSIHLFRFPFKNPVKLRKWVDAVKIPGFWPLRSTRICNDHFLETDYETSPHMKIPRLKDSAVPCRNLAVFQAGEARSVLPKPETSKNQATISIANAVNNSPPSKPNTKQSFVVINSVSSSSVLPKPESTSKPSFIIANSLNNQNKIVCLTGISSLNKTIQRTNGPIVLRPLPPLVPTSNVKKDASTQMANNSHYLNNFKQKKILDIFSNVPPLSPIVNQVETPNRTIGVQTKIESEKEIRLKRKVRLLQQKIRRKEKKISCLKEVLYALRKRGVLEPDAGELIDHYFDDSE